MKHGNNEQNILIQIQQLTKNTQTQHSNVTYYRKSCQCPSQVSKNLSTSFQVQSALHYTNIPIDKYLNFLKNYLAKSKTKSLPNDKLLLISRDFCLYHSSTTFNKLFYKQNFGLPMCSSISNVLTCLFLEFIKSSSFQNSLPQNTEYFCNIDDRWENTWSLKTWILLLLVDWIHQGFFFLITTTFEALLSVLFLLLINSSYFVFISMLGHLHLLHLFLYQANRFACLFEALITYHMC